MSETTTYRGTIVAVSPGGHIEVSLTDAPKCEGCAISSACGSRPSSRIVTAVATDTSASAFAVGESVEVSCPPHSNGRAMLWGIVYPCILLVALSLLLPLTGADTSLTAACSLAAVAVYYIILALMRKHLDKRLMWRVKKC